MASDATYLEGSDPASPRATERPTGQVIGRFPGETTCLSLCWAVLDLIITHSNGITFTDLDHELLDRLRRDLDEPSSSQEVIAA